MIPIKTIPLSDGSKLDIWRDDPAEHNPRQWSTLGTMVCFHQKYCLGDAQDYHGYDRRNFNTWLALEARIVKDHDPLVILPLYMMDHSGLSVSTTDETFKKCDQDGWDWGQIGFIFVSKEKAKDLYFKKKTSKKLVAMVQQVLVSEVDTYDLYLRGEIYGFTLTDPNGEEDGVGGFFGDDIFQNGMLDHLPEDVKQQILNSRQSNS